MSPLSIVLAHEEPFQIGQAEVRPATRELECDGKTAIIEPRVMQVLVALHRAKGAVVSKDDLVTCCWDGRIVGDDAINRVIGRLRHEASAHAGDAFRVETITRVGYRLVESGAKAKRFSLDRRQLVAGGTAAAVAAGGGLILLERRQSRLPTEAEQLIDEGRAAFRDGTPDQLAKAVASFRRATEIAPDSAVCWGALALAYQRIADSSSTRDSEIVGMRANYARRRALGLDPDNGDALAAGVFALPLFGNWLNFEKSVHQALKRRPKHAQLNWALANCLSQVGRFAEALFYVDRAFKFDPGNPFGFLFRVGLLADMGRLDEAEKLATAGTESWPRHYATWFARFYLFAFNGRAREALAMIDDQASRPTGIPDWNWAMTRLQAQAMLTQSKADIDAAADSALATAHRGVGFAQEAILFLGAVGRTDEAYRMIYAYFFGRGFTPGETRWSSEQGQFTPRRNLHTYLLFRSFMKPVRSDPRFPALTRELHLDDYWRNSRTRPDFLA